MYECVEVKVKQAPEDNILPTKLYCGSFSSIQGLSLPVAEV